MSLVLYILVFISCFYLMLVVLSVNTFNPKDWLIKTLRRDSLQDAYRLQSFLMHNSDLSKKDSIPEYKFYTEIVSILFNCRNSFGGEVETSLFEVRKNIGRDVKETRKLRELFLSGVMQNLFLSGFIIFFYFYSRFTVQSPISFIEMAILSCWLFGGIIFFIIAFKVIERKRFSLFQSYLVSFYKFKVLLSISRPINQILKESNIGELKNSKSVGHLKIRIENLVKKIKNTGKFSQFEMDFIMTEIWDFFEFELVKFNKITNMLKLLSIMIFVLPCFLYSTLSLMEHFNL